MELVCEFKYIGTKYTSIIFSSSITEPNTIIQKINGNHVQGRRNKDVDVEMICFEDTTVNFFPQGLNKIFPNLTDVEIYNCGLKSITRRDLVGLENIHRLQCDNNNITSLPGNLFRNMPHLIRISFRHNDLQFMSSELLTSKSSLFFQLIDFRENHSIDACFINNNYCIKGYETYQKKVDSVFKLMVMIDEKCDKPMKHNDQTFLNTKLKDNKQTETNKKLKDFKKEGFKELWTTGQLSDITIVTDTKKFKAHKVILAVQSSVFTSIFKDKMKDRPSDEIHLKTINSNIMKTFLKFFYTDEVEKEEISNLFELFSLAAKFKVENLMKIVEGMITDDLNNVDNAIEIFELACRFNYDEMKTSAFKVIQSTFDEPLKNELMNQPEVVKELFEAKRNFDLIVKKYKNL